MADENRELTVRTVAVGSAWFDYALEGGLRFVQRLPHSAAESAVVLLRGGPGTGKSVLAQNLSLGVAENLGCDVLYVCIEILPTEIRAQRAGFDGYEPGAVIDLANPQDGEQAPAAPRLVVGLADIGDDPAFAHHAPQLDEAILKLWRVAKGRGFAPKVVVVDALSDGYRLGASMPRSRIDGVCKLAAEQGWVLILAEEEMTAAPSPWAFAVDTVLSLRFNAQNRRHEMLVAKHRFGPSKAGPHPLSFARE